MRLIDADELLAHRFVGVIGEAEKSSYMVGWNTAIEAVVENAPTIDAVPVVRCRECKYWHRSLSPDGKIEYFNFSGCTKMHDGYPDFYCADGQRREDGDE